jgi:ABC-type uncharacterized transport system permease subunit
LLQFTGQGVVKAGTCPIALRPGAAIHQTVAADFVVVPTGMMMVMMMTLIFVCTHPPIFHLMMPMTVFTLSLSLTRPLMCRVSGCLCPHTIH